MTCRVRDARPEDAAAISRVILTALRETNAGDYAPAVIDRVSENFSPTAVAALMIRRTVLVAVFDGTVAGTASLDGAVVRTVFVAPEAQGRGVGRALMGEIERIARGVCVGTLAVPSTVTAEGFYARLGYRAVREAHQGDERTIVMEKMLGR